MAHVTSQVPLGLHRALRFRDLYPTYFLSLCKHHPTGSASFSSRLQLRLQLRLRFRLRLRISLAVWLRLQRRRSGEKGCGGGSEVREGGEEQWEKESEEEQWRGEGE